MSKKKGPVKNISESFLFLISHERYYYFLLFFIIFLLLMSIFLFFQSKDDEKFFCGDNTKNGSCSLTKPYYCANGALVEKASVCSCPEGLLEDDDQCISQYHINPKNISLKYILNGKEGEINFTVYNGLVDYLSEIPRSIETLSGEEISRADFKFKKINNENQKIFLLPLVLKIKSLSKNKEEQMKIAVSIVQNIEWGYSNKTVRFAGTNVPYSRYPYEILYDSQGICGEKSELLLFLLRELEYETVLFYNLKENHESVGVKCPVRYSWNNSGYCFIETSGPSVITDTSINYIGGIKLESKPQIFNISQGFSLGENLEEYKDARKIMKIRGRSLGNGRVGLFDKFRLSKLNKKYGLSGTYNLE